MKIDKQKLQEALTIVKPGLASKELLEQTTSFAFIDGRVVTYNDEISISQEVEGVDFEGAIKAEELYGLLSRLTHDEVDMEVKGDELLINSGRVKAGLKLEQEISLPLKEIADDWEEIDTQEFVEYMLLAARTCSTDMSQPKLTCVCIRDQKVLGSDGHRLIQCQLKNEFPEDELLIPAIAVFELIKIEPTHIQVEENWVHFKNTVGATFSCRRMNEVYVTEKLIKSVLKINGDAEVTFPNKIQDVLGRVSSFAKRDFTLEETIEVEIENGKALLKAETKDTKSWIKEKVSVESTEDIAFNMIPSLFMDILKMTNTCYLDDAMTKGKFMVAGEWEYIIMLRKDA